MKELNVVDELLAIERKYNVNVVYCTYSGSKLYGTNNANSDTDFKFIFVPKKVDVLLKQDVEHIDHSTNKTKNKNGKNDVDFDGYSIYKFLKLLEKSETGAVDILFSMFREDTIVHEYEKFTGPIKDNYKSLLNRNMKSFIGYALGQSKKFGIKGARYDELNDFTDIVKSFVGKQDKLELSFDSLEKVIKAKQYKYIKLVEAPGPRGSGSYRDIKYISVLGKLFAGSIRANEFYEKVIAQEAQFGNRTKTVAETDDKVDWKALSHAYRIAAEVKELLETGFITFPLLEAELVKDIKYGRMEVEATVNLIEETLSAVDSLLETTTIPESSDRVYMNIFLLSLVNEAT